MKSLKVGWIGTGIMGQPMCGHLVKAGFECFVYSRTQSKTAPLVALGAKGVDNPQAVASEADIIFTIVSLPEDVERVYFGDKGLFKTPMQGKIFVDMSTSSPSLAQKIAQYAESHAAKALDAPVSGGDVGAKNATLSIMAGGEKETFNEVKPLFEQMGKSISYQGLAGSGQHTKMANQIAIAGSMIGCCESLIYAAKAGLNLESVLQAISSGAAGSWSLANLAPRICQQDFEPGFIVAHFVKDMRIALDQADKMNLCLPGLSLVKQLYHAVMNAGYGQKGTQALFLALKQMNL